MMHSKQEVYDSNVKNDIELLGNILGQVIKEQSGQESFDLVEKIRLTSITSRLNSSTTCLDDLFLIIRHLSADESVVISRAFGHFLNLVNIIENTHGIAHEILNESLLNIIDQALHNRNLAKSKIYETIESLSIQLVLTAHPTEVKRRTLIEKHNEISILIQQRQTTKNLYEQSEIDRKLHAIMTNLWLTDEIRRKRPTPIEEAKWGCTVIEKSIWYSISQYFRRLNYLLNKTNLPKLSLNKTPITFGSWMGGDRDGNPFVTAKTTEEVVMLYRWQALRLILTDINQLIQELSIGACSAKIKKLTNNAHEPYRVLLRELRDKIQYTLHWYGLRIKKRRFRLDSACIQEVDEIITPLELIYHSLKQNGAESLASDHLEDLIRNVHTFGLHLLKLDLRQESGEHENVIAQIYKHLGLGDYKNLNEADKVAWLVDELESNRPLFGDDCQFDEMGQEVINTFKTIAFLPQDQFGSYVISMASSASDILSVALLQKTLGIKKPLPVVPLFETLNDLKNSAVTLEKLFNIPWYKEYCQGTQEVMIGYSDSAKDAGKLAASWQLYQAQKEITDVANRHHIHIVFFHGRGGSIGRGGGPIQAALLSQPPETVAGSIKVTEQGEVIHKKFGSMETTQKSLMLYTNAVLQATLTPPKTPKAQWIKLMDELSQNSTDAYRQVVNQDDLFFEYFTKATPCAELGRLSIGSRPTKRKKQDSLSALRAIPWIFAWTQTRLLLPSWIGMEQTLKVALSKDKKQIDEMIKQWPFFSIFIDLLNMTLLKSDQEISQYYDTSLSQELQQYGGYLRNKLKLMYQVNEQLQTLAHKETLTLDLPVIEYRRPYIDPLNLVQAYALQKMDTVNEHSVEYQRYEDALMLSISGIAAGMKNTG